MGFEETLFYLNYRSERIFILRNISETLDEKTLIWKQRWNDNKQICIILRNIAAQPIETPSNLFGIAVDDVTGTVMSTCSWGILYLT